MATITYLHGFASGPKPHSPKVALLRSLGHRVQCLNTEGGYRPEDYLRAVAALPQVPSPPHILVGSSLGGFWARRLGAQYGCAWVALNPALRPSETLSRYAGQLQRFDVDASFDWHREDAIAYRVLEQEPLPSGAPGLIILADDDEIVDATETQALAADADVFRLPRGGHDLANTTDYAEALSSFIKAHA